MNGLTFKKINSTEPVVKYLANLISEKLSAGQRILWLVPGGSAMSIAVEVSKLLPKTALTRLTVSLTDERYGNVGHTDSNWQQLKNSGFDWPGATMLPVLAGKNLEQTTKDYSQLLEKSLKSADYSLALAGTGTDGHILGIKPHSPAVESPNLAVGYEWSDYIRITATTSLLEKLNEIVVYAVGQEKWPQLDDLEKDIDPNKQPAQLLKKLKKVIIFNDYKGEPV